MKKSKLTATKAAAQENIQEPISTMVWIINICVVTMPLIGFIMAIVFLWGWGFSWVDLSLLVSMYMLTVLGITVGFHRLFTHRSFETTRPIEYIFAILGSMAAQGPLLKWVALHRCHHQYSDKGADPHSPNNSGKGFIGFVRGFWHSHIGWFFDPDPANLQNYVKDLSRNKTLSNISALFPLWVAIGLLIPAVIGGLISGTWQGFLFGLLWGGLARMFLVHHVTWSINSVCHLWGRRAFKTTDSSRNNVVFGILALGEGWHNNHHAFPTSARHGLKWWQLDISYLVIYSLAALKLAWKVRLPNEQAIAA